jgi:hypothetical protein
MTGNERQGLPRTEAEIDVVVRRNQQFVPYELRNDRNPPLSEYMSEQERRQAARVLRKSRTAMSRLIKMLEGDGRTPMDDAWDEERQAGRGHSIVQEAVKRWEHDNHHAWGEFVQEELARRQTPEWVEAERERLRQVDKSRAAAVAACEERERRR